MFTLATNSSPLSDGSTKGHLAVTTNVVNRMLLSTLACLPKYIDLSSYHDDHDNAISLCMVHLYEQ